jgi:hypothetical protein
METTDISNKGYVNPHGSGTEKSAPKTPQDCEYFHTCSASLCPLDPGVSTRIWYSNEAICKNRDFSNLDFIKTQKKISKLNKRYAVSGLFTLKMLNRSLIVRVGLGGLNEGSDSNRLRKYEQNWILRHKGISIEQKKKMIERLSKGKSENEGLL